MNTKLIPAIALALAAAGCASTPPSYPALDLARSEVRAAEADPNVARYAPLDMQAARDQLQLAEAAALHRDRDAIDQPAYLAGQNAKLAQLHAAAKADDARVAAGQSERDRIQLAARTREVDSAKSQADSATLARDQETQRAALLQAQVDALKAKPTDRGLVLTLGDVLFDSGRAELNAGGARNLGQLVQFLNDHPERHVEIDGYTDSIGTDSFNLALSQERADAVRAELVGRGIDPMRIVSRGYGKQFAVASNGEASGRQLNRRVEVVIGGDNGAPVAGRGPSL